MSHHPPTTPRREDPPARRRPGTATAAGGLGIVYGLVVTCAGAAGAIVLTEARSTKDYLGLL
ncbi:hypothetical protein ACIGO8_07170 [Streptomyces sp. NPDC053493]|uniref:hypothetical protein n=1 Tax=Streptomyces sp. NPDC053493 TaxID=3365705 RepID=UPI0037D653BB